MRRFAALLLTLTLLLAAVPASAAEPPQIMIDGHVLTLPADQQPVILSGRTLLPMRELFQALGAEIAWDQNTRTVTATKGATVVTVTLGSSQARIDGHPLTLDVPAQLIGDRTYIPVRMAGTALGATVEWDANHRAVLVRSATAVAGVSAAPGAMERVTLAAGAAVEGNGLYFLDVAGGQVEGWRVAGNTDWTSFTASDDNRFVTATPSGGNAYLADRTTGAVYGWDPYTTRLMATGPDRLLFERTVGDGPGVPTTVTVADGALKPLRTLTLPGPANGAVSPDGAHVALISTGKLYLADVATGELKVIGEMTVPDGRQADATAMQVLSSGKEFAVVTATRPTAFPYTDPFNLALIRRYDWNGKLLSDSTVPGSHVSFREDGRLLTWEESLIGGVQIIHIDDVATGQPLVRVRNASFCTGRPGPSWLTGAGSLVVRTRDGAQVLAADGGLAKLNAGEDALPAPGKDGLFAAAANKVVNASGAAVREAAVSPDQAWAYGSIAPWGSTAAELRFIRQPARGHDGPCGEYNLVMPFSPKVDKAPFGNALRLKVQAADGLTVRATATTGGKVVATVPAGSAVTMVKLSEALQSIYKQESPLIYADEHRWLYVQTDAGQSGWVAAEPVVLTWAN